MPPSERRWRRFLSGSADAGISFAELCAILQAIGFTERIRGSHHIFTRDGIPEIVNIQPQGSKARQLAIRYDLLNDVDS
jgi:predicted RNA binding protein YcfA (HicA-like mRNA interferase family)